MVIWLLDANVLIAAQDDQHTHYHRVRRWWGTERPVATCPIVEGALVRYLVRVGFPPDDIRTAIRKHFALPHHEFWPDDLSYADADLSQVIGHRQVTDSYLVSLVRRHGPNARLATLDTGLAKFHPDVVDLVPELPEA